MLKLNSLAPITALTGFPGQQDEETAFESRVDNFTTKPVRFWKIEWILEGCMRSRQREARGSPLSEDGVRARLRSTRLWEVQRERRELDENITGEVDELFEGELSGLELSLMVCLSAALKVLIL